MVRTYSYTVDKLDNGDSSKPCGAFHFCVGIVAPILGFSYEIMTVCLLLKMFLLLCDWLMVFIVPFIVHH